MNRPAAGETPPVLAIVGATGTGKSDLPNIPAEFTRAATLTANDLERAALLAEAGRIH